MLEITDIANLPELSETAVAIGKFDGLHLGHQQLLHELVEYAQESGLVPAVITFDRHPKALLFCLVVVLRQHLQSQIHRSL